VTGDRYALGYFGLAYYVENQSKLKAVQIDHGKGNGCVTPSAQSVEAGTYTPLARPIFIYVRKDAADRPEVKAFVEFYLKNAAKLVGDVGYVPLPAKVYDLASARFTSGKTGTAYTGDTAGLTLEQIFSRN
jgi:phosphate transport system substrate-binding protein